MTLRLVPLTLAQANELVARWHRHHKPARAHRFSIGVINGLGEFVGAAIVARPVSRRFPAYTTAEVVRLVTNGTRNACSILYGAAARAAQAMGFARIQTYTLEEENGASLRASGWIDEGVRDSRAWNDSCGIERKNEFPTTPKRRWSRRLNQEIEGLSFASS